MSTRFELFAATHLSALCVTAALAVGLALYVRRDRDARAPVARVLAVVVLAAGVGFIAVEALAGTPWRSIAPFHLCDIAVFVGAWALWTRAQQPFELLYFWGLSGTALAMLTPDLAEDFPHWRFSFYFAQHGSLVVAALVLALGFGMRPRRGGVWRAWLYLNGVAVVVGAINAAFDTNFLYLCRPPGAASPLDWFGPWPWYILVSEAIALGCFALLALPFVRASPSGSRPSP